MWPVMVDGPRNRTVVRGAHVTFSCLVESSSSSDGGNGVEILWQFNGGNLSSQGSSPWRQLDNGTLVLDGVDVAESGPYRCIARNAHGVTHSEPAYLVVHGEPTLFFFLKRSCFWSESRSDRTCVCGQSPVYNKNFILQN
ncbi:hypothetical protein HPB48_017459 [Haemaphysalis longicornis]|uniref:Ig-like domain-containing protein n=1 Tax=Haemaphysalis longicornis TaxID=44386 RepID=A0A9J6FVZ9_HAELO|nr:hypothetical protein HPB48_017459 [Haemaphysalis longicornis]